MISEERINSTNSTVYLFDEFRLEAESLLLLRNSKVVPLAPKAVEVLRALIEADGKLLTKAEILDRVWANTFVEEANLAQHISALRKALGEDKNGRKFIETIPRRGYRFVAEVKDSDGRAGEIVITEREQTRVSEQFEIETQQSPPENIVRAGSVNLPKALPENRKSRWRVWLAGAVVVFIFAVAGYGVYKYLNPAPLIFEAGKTTRLTSTGRVIHAAIAPDGKLVAYAQEENGERQSLWIRHVGSESAVQIAAPSAVEYRGLNIAPDGNSLYYIVGQGALYKIPLLGGAAVKIADDLSTQSTVSASAGISPDSRQIAFVRRFEKDTSALFVVDSDGSNEKILAEFEQPTRLSPIVAWSPDGKAIACRVTVNGRQNVLAVQVADGTSAPVLPQNISSLQQMTWLTDSKSLLATGDYGHIFQIFYPSGEKRDLQFVQMGTKEIGLSANNRFLATVKTESAAYVWKMPANGGAADAKQLTAGFEKEDGIRGLGWMSGGRILYDSPTNKEDLILTIGGDGHSEQIAKGSFPAVSPDGRLVVYQKSLPSGGSLFQTDTNDGRETQLTSGARADIWQTFSSDGKTLVFTRFAERVGLWKMLSAGGEATLILEENAICPAISPDGKTIAFILRRAGNLPSIALVSIDGSAIIRTFDAKPEKNSVTGDKQTLQWTADGRGIYFIRLIDGVSNIWRQPVDGGEPVQVTDFKTGRIFNFAFSSDGSQIALSRGTINSDVVLIENGK